MAELKAVKEFLGTGIGTEGSLLIVKKIADTLVSEVEKKILNRGLAALYFGPNDIPGASIDIDSEDVDTLSVRPVGEGSEYPISQQEYSEFNMKPKKYGCAIKITREMMEDGKWNLLERNTRMAARRLAENENNLIITDALDNAAATTAGGAAITIANITESMYDLDSNNYDTTDFIIGAEVLQDIRNIDTFVEYNKAGDQEMIKKGMRGNIYGMNVHLVTSGINAKHAYVMDRGNAYVIAEKRSITVEGFKLEIRDMEGVTVSQRIKVRHLRSEAISKITTT